MKILQIITLCELGGAQSVVVNLSNELCKEHEVIVAAGEGDGKMFLALNDCIKQEHLVHLKRELSLKHDVLVLVELRNLYRKYNPDVIHLHSSKAGMLGRVAFPSTKVVYTVHGFDSIRLAYRKFLPMERFMQHFCKAIVGVSNYDKKWMEAEGIRKSVYTIYNGVQCNDKDIPGWPISSRKKILCIARTASPKRVDIFLETATLLPEYDFIWIGNQYAITEHPNNVYFLGNIPKAANCNQVVDLFMLPSNYEGLPMVILEAMSCKRPVVASNVGGISEIVRNGENGYTVENNAEDFAIRIKEILEDEDAYKRFSENAYRRFIEDLTVEKMVKSYLEIYKK